jgi:hypothetical protein
MSHLTCGDGDLCGAEITDAYRRFRCANSGPDFEVPTVGLRHVYVGTMFPDI